MFKYLILFLFLLFFLSFLFKLYLLLELLLLPFISFSILFLFLLLLPSLFLHLPFQFFCILFLLSLLLWIISLTTCKSSLQKSSFCWVINRCWLWGGTTIIVIRRCLGWIRRMGRWLILIVEFLLLAIESISWITCRSFHSILHFSVLLLLNLLIQFLLIFLSLKSCCIACLLLLLPPAWLRLRLAKFRKEVNFTWLWLLLRPLALLRLWFELILFPLTNLHV